MTSRYSVQLLAVHEDGTATAQTWRVCEHLHGKLTEVFTEKYGSPSVSIAEHDNHGHLTSVSEIPETP